MNTSFALAKLFARLNFVGERASAKINTPRKLIVVKVNENSLDKLIARRRADPTDRTLQFRVNANCKQTQKYPFTVVSVFA